MTRESHQKSAPLVGELTVRCGPDAGVSRSLLVPVTLIGCDEHCDLRIIEEDVRAVHCVVSVTPDGPYLRSVGGATIVNSLPTLSRLLQTGDVLEIGPVELEVHWYLPPGPTTNGSAVWPRPKLVEHEADEPMPTRREAG